MAATGYAGRSTPTSSSASTLPTTSYACPPDAVVTGATRLRELQNEGIEQLILVVEIKSDDDDTEETRAKEAYAKEHFAALNRRLRETQEVDVAEALP